MTAIVVNHLRSKLSKRSNISIAVIYCSYNMRETQKKERLLGEVLRQLVRPEHSSFEPIQAVIDKCTTEDRRLRFDELADLTRHVLGFYNRAYIIIDALDECDSMESLSLTAELQRLQALLPSLRLMITFRPQVVVEDSFSNVAELEIRASDEDLNCYINNNIARLTKHVMESPTIKNDVVESIIKAASGM